MNGKEFLAERLSKAFAGCAKAMEECVAAMNKLRTTEYKPEGSKYHK